MAVLRNIIISLCIIFIVFGFNVCLVMGASLYLENGFITTSETVEVCTISQRDLDSKSLYSYLETSYSEIVEVVKSDSLVKHYEGGYDLTDYEVLEIARIAYLEAGHSEYQTLYLTVCVILNRYLDWYGGIEGGNTIDNVIHAEGQYSTSSMYTDYDGEELYLNEQTLDAVYDALNNTDRNPHFQASNGCLNDTGKILYYTDGTTEIYY